MASRQHYVWAAGHILLLLTTARYLLAYITFKSAGYSAYYKVSYVGALVSYAIVCYKALGTPQPNAAFFRRAAIDENVQYFVLALFWLFSKPVPISLVPFATFSLFHALTFLRSNVLPRIFPPTPSATAGAPPQQHPVLRTVQVWIKSNYDGAMRIVAYTELVILFRITIGALPLPFIHASNSLLAPLVFAHFLRARWYQSTFTQAAVVHVNQLIQREVTKPGRPGWMQGVWAKVKMGVNTWAGSTVIGPSGMQAGAAGQPTN